MHQEIAVVFTAKSVERILREGGSAAWRLAPWRARQCRYVVCTRNTLAPWAEPLGTDHAHGSAFLIGKVSNVVPCQPTPENREASKDRYLIKISEFARVNIPNVWKAERNPIKYMPYEAVGIDFETLTWEPIPSQAISLPMPESSTPEPAAQRKGLTIAEAKSGLAQFFNVAPDAIEITIRG